VAYWRNQKTLGGHQEETRIWDCKTKNPKGLESVVVCVLGGSRKKMAQAQGEVFFALKVKRPGTRHLGPRGKPKSIHREKEKP